MNRLEANLLLYVVTFFWGIQYMFLKNVPDSVSDFGFLALTNGIGFVLVSFVFYKEFAKITKGLILKSAAAAFFLVAFNFLQLMGASGLDSSAISFITAAYILFVPFFMKLLKKKVKVNSWIGVGITVIGLLFATGADLTGTLRGGAVFILFGDVFFALYIVFLDGTAKDCNPVLLSIGQMFFGMIFSVAGWAIESPGTFLKMPGDQKFWVSVLMVAFFIRALSTILQIYAQRYVTAVDASVILSLEIVFTMITALFLPKLIGGETEQLTAGKITGCIVIFMGVLATDDEIFRKTLGRILYRDRKQGEA